MSNSGWIKLHRSLLDWEWYNDMNVRIVFIHCLLKANSQDIKLKGLLIKRGSFPTGLEKLAKETGLTIAQIRVTLNKLKMTNEITSQTSSEGSIISITNYDLYQSNDKRNDTQIANEMTNESQTNDKPIATNKNIRSIKKERKEEVRKPDSVSDETWQTWIQFRKEKKAPVSKLVVDAFVKDCFENNCDVENTIKFWVTYKSLWQGFRFDWLKPDDLQKIRFGTTQPKEEQELEFIPAN